jgi:hypothetical protein
MEGTATNLLPLEDDAVKPLIRDGIYHRRTEPYREVLRNIESHAYIWDQ